MSAAPSASAPATPAKVKNPAQGRLLAAQKLIGPYRLTPVNKDLLLPIAFIPTHPKNRKYDPEYAKELGRGIKDRLDVYKHPCQGIVGFKKQHTDLVDPKRETAAEAFARISALHPEAFEHEEDTRTDHEDLSWLFDNFTVSS